MPSPTRWVLKYDIDEEAPDHSTFSKARARYGRDAYERFFSEIARKYKEKGLIYGDKVFVDATLVKGATPVAKSSQAALSASVRYLAHSICRSFLPGCSARLTFRLM